jgi:hypothetical protein
MSKYLLSIEDSIADRHNQVVSTYVWYSSDSGADSTLAGRISYFSSIPQDKCEYSAL